MKMGLKIGVRFTPECYCNLMEVVIGFMEGNSDAITLEGLKMSIVGPNEG